MGRDAVTFFDKPGGYGRLGSFLLIFRKANFNIIRHC
jgi:hypothetical protein